MSSNESTLFEAGRFTMPGGTPGNAFDAPFESDQFSPEKLGVDAATLNGVVAGLNALQRSGLMHDGPGGIGSRNAARDATRDVPMAKDIPDVSPKSPSKDQGRELGRDPQS